ncbi:MAG TPA: electron transport complex subunit RsxC [Clostridiales bacterium]|nr:electron transport complex subunit RsxC [Clostridiales bacterium]
MYEIYTIAGGLELKHYFHGGIHPADGTDKQLSNQKPIRIYAPKTVEISMKQSPGSICEAAVKVGDKVSKGDLIGRPVEFGGANIHASISGTIIDIRTDSDFSGRKSEIIVIQSDDANADETNSISDYEESLVDLSGYTKEEIIIKMNEGGIIGLGGAGFPTHIKYETKERIKYILINAAECEPYLTCDHMLIMEHGYAVINGVLLLVKASDADKAIICFEDNKQDAAKHLESIVSDKELPIEIKILPTRYPQGGERQLVEAVLRMEVPAGKLPASIGVIINNVGTAKAVADTVIGSIPLITRVVTVTGEVKEPCNYMVPIGTRFCELIELSGGYTIKDQRVIEGGPMTGICLQIGGTYDTLSGSVTKATSGLVVLKDVPKDETPCIRCGECERVCPAGLAPFKIDFAAIEDDISLCNKLYATECISCGCCSYVCPAKRELAYRITEAKTEIYRLGA